jgi:hypothetical protein
LAPKEEEEDPEVPKIPKMLPGAPDGGDAERDVAPKAPPKALTGGVCGEASTA